jgi:hypothetical protein
MTKGIYIKYILLFLIVSSILIFMYLGNPFAIEKFSINTNDITSGISNIGSSAQSVSGQIQGQISGQIQDAASRSLPGSIQGSAGYMSSSISNIPSPQNSVLLLPGVPMPEEIKMPGVPIQGLLPITGKGEVGKALQLPSSQIQSVGQQIQPIGQIQQALKPSSGNIQSSTLGNPFPSTVIQIPSPGNQVSSFDTRFLQLPSANIKGPMQVPSGISYTMPTGMFDSYQKSLQMPSGLPSGVPANMQSSQMSIPGQMSNQMSTKMKSYVRVFNEIPFCG